ncbi:hypothetical protein BE11_12780 [Sorangium cellulosum]|nr:hypothetical protein BE11_12780 [Sorangium cellulosum]
MSTAVLRCNGSVERATVIVSTRSLPLRVITAGAPYAQQLRETAGEVARRVAARGSPAGLVFQSQGMTGDAWLGPDLPDACAHLAADGIREALIVPIGFVAHGARTLC